MRMATKNNDGLTNEGYYVNAADLADEIAVLMQYGLDPLFISTSTWALVQRRQYQRINREEALINPVVVRVVLPGPALAVLNRES
jgi:hypothetical protein